MPRFPFVGTAGAAPFVVCGCLVSVLLAGCARPGESNPARDAAVFLGVATNPPSAQPFVVEARKPGQEDYMPVGITPPARKLKTRTPEEVKKLQDELDNALKRNEAAGAISPAPKP
jgi:hypothetical protein